MTMSWSLFFNVIGLAMGLIGAGVLIAFELRQFGTLLRYWETTSPPGGACAGLDWKIGWGKQAFLWVAKKCGSNDVMDMGQEPALSAALRKALGLLLILLSFLGQVLGNILMAIGM